MTVVETIYTNFELRKAFHTLKYVGRVDSTVDPDSYATFDNEVVVAFPLTDAENIDQVTHNDFENDDDETEIVPHDISYS